jgi:hypothetical protein
MQQLPSGNVVVDWGTAGAITEFTSDGEVQLDLDLGGGMFTYRAFRLPWKGTPARQPTVAVVGRTAYVSWNGATEVAYWQLLTGPLMGKLTAKTTVPKRGFETAIPLPSGSGYVAVAALDARKQRLGVTVTSRV